MRTRHANETCGFAREINGFLRIEPKLASTRGTCCVRVNFFNFWQRKQGKRAKGHGITGKTGQKSPTLACSFKSAVRKGCTTHRTGRTRSDTLKQWCANIKNSRFRRLRHFCDGCAHCHLVGDFFFRRYGPCVFLYPHDWALADGHMQHKLEHRLDVRECTRVAHRFSPS